MNIFKQYKALAVLLIGTFIVFIPYMWFIRTPYFEVFQAWAHQNEIILSVSLVTIKVIGIVFPPIPGGLVILGSIPVFGWFTAYLIDLTGTIIGSSIAFYLGRKYGHKILPKLFDKSIIERIDKIKIKKNREIESMVVLRFILGSTFTEIICYAAGVLKLSYKNFIIGTIIAHIIVVAPTYYFASNLFSGQNLWVNVVILIIALPLFWRLRGRYLE